MANIITIGSSEIRSINGLFSLNDLHKASGNAAKHKPAFFLRNDQTKALIDEIAKGADMHLSTTTGSKGGTYACRELVIAYAAWISPAFHLKVIRVFLDKETRQSLPMIPADKPNLSNTRWRMNIDDDGRATMSIIPKDAMIATEDQLLEWVQQVGESTPFKVDYVQRLAVACIHRLDKEVEQWKSHTSKAYDHLRNANFRIRELEAQQ